MIKMRKITIKCKNHKKMSIKKNEKEAEKKINNTKMTKISIIEGKKNR